MTRTDIEKRLSEMKEEIEKADSTEKIEAINKEMDSLKAERDAMFQKETEVRAKFDSMKKVEAPAKFDGAEERAAKFAETGKMVIPAREARATLLSGGTLAVPTGVNGIGDAQNVVSSIVDRVTVTDLTGLGEYKEAFQKSIQSADAGAEGTAPDASDPEFGTVTIRPHLVETVSYVSKAIAKQSPLNYEAKVRNGALAALRKKVASYIIGGNGTTQPSGIYNAKDDSTIPVALNTTLDVITIDATTLRKIVFNYGGDENVDTNAVLLLNKKDLVAFGDVRGTNEKKAIYDIIPDGANPNTGVIKDGGLTVPYIICSDCTSLKDSTQGDAAINTMIYGNIKAYELGLFGDYSVETSRDEKFSAGLLSIRGEVYVGGNVILDKGFVIVTLPAEVSA